MVLVGYGRVGRRIARALSPSTASPSSWSSRTASSSSKLRARNLPAVSGDAADPAVLIQAHIARAGMLVVATPGHVRRPAGWSETARTLNPAIEVVVRTHDEEEARLLESESVGTVFIGERELAMAMARTSSRG